MNIVRYGAVAVTVLCVWGWTPIAAAEDSGATIGKEESGVNADLRSQAREAEREYRHRLAKLRRLREISAHGNAPDRVAEIDGLYERLRANHKSRLARLRSRLRGAAQESFDAEMSKGRDRLEWVQEHRERAKELLAEHRQERFDHRQEARDKRFDHRQDVRQEKFDGRQDRREDHFDHRQEARDKRFDHRQDVRQEKFDGRQAKREHRQDMREKHSDHRQAAREQRFDRHQAARESRRQAAENSWAEAREQAAAETGSVRSRTGVISRHAARRWQAETRRQQEEGLQRAARRNGILWGGSADQPRKGRTLPTQREADEAAARSISISSADAELERLRREINGSR